MKWTQIERQVLVHVSDEFMTSIGWTPFSLILYDPTGQRPWWMVSEADAYRTIRPSHAVEQAGSVKCHDLETDHKVELLFPAEPSYIDLVIGFEGG
jgi:hypothetical protein